MARLVVLVNLNLSTMKKAIIIILSILSCFAVKAQIPQPDPDTTARHFLIVASIGNLQEASAGQLAVQKGIRAEVRSFGQMMIKDHGEAEQKLLQLAQVKGYKLPAAATGGIKPDLNLKNAGANFDKLYVHAMVAGHANTVQMFENYATTGKDPDVRAFAQRMLPTLKAHLAAIKAINQQLNSK
jgi:putative membrane protein